MSTPHDSSSEHHPGDDPAHGERDGHGHDAHAPHGAHRHGDDGHAGEGHDRHGDPARHFDERAADWDDEAKVERSRVVARAIREQVDVDATTRVFEYGAGTGLTAQHLASDGAVGPVTLADPSAGMRQVMAAKVADGRLPADARITSIDLASDDAADPQWDPAARFDLIVTVMALHHIPDAARAVAAMAQLLAPGGHLAIVDLDAEDGSFHADLEDFGGHDGFDRDRLTAMLVEGGFDEPTWQHVHHVVKHDQPYPLFLAVATVTA